MIILLSIYPLKMSQSIMGILFVIICFLAYISYMRMPKLEERLTVKKSDGIPVDASEYIE